MGAELSSFPAPFDAVVIGAGGGLGGAFVEALAELGAVRSLLAVARRPTAFPHAKVTSLVADVTDERALAAAAARAPSEVRLVIVAAGLLHDPAAGIAPEKRMQDLNADALARLFAVNTIGPSLALKHFAPLLPRQGKSVFAALSARVGSIGDNRLGGWYGYRAAKAGLNMILKTAAIEIAARRREAVILGLHPGTVETRLSAPFLGAVKPDALMTPAASAARLLAVIDAAGPDATGAVLAYDGARVPP